MVHFSSILPNQLGFTLVSGDLKLRFLHVAGKGAYGIVYLAWDMSTPESAPKFYAVKCTLKYEAGTEFETLQKREIIYHSAMSGHPNVTSLYRVIQEEYYVYFVLDYHDGGDLFGAIVERKTFERNDTAVKLAIVQLLDAVQACHDAGISHRDLKPENIMCTRGDSHFFLTDFGLATQTGLSNNYGCGSSHYMSPECVGSLEAAIPYSTRRSDTWSLGIILINIITGRNPWHIANIARDEGFAQFCKSPALFLASMLPMSREAASMLSRVLDPHPRTRMGIAEFKEAVIAIRTFFPETDAPDYIRIGDESFRASLQHTAQPAAGGSGDILDDIFDDGELIMDVPFDFPHTSSMSGFSSVPLDSPCCSEFVNQTPSSTSSLDTDESHLPSTPPSPPIEMPAVVPTLALAANAEDTGIISAGRCSFEAPRPQSRMRKVRRLVGAFRRATIRT